MTLLEYILYLVYYLALLLTCFLIGCFSVRKRWTLEYKLLFMLSGLTLLVETPVNLLQLKRIDIRWLYNFFVPIECFTILYLFYRASIHLANKRLNAILLVLVPIAFGLICFRHPPTAPMDEYDSLFYCFAELISAGMFLVDVFLVRSDISLTGRPPFWISLGMLFFCSIFLVIEVMIMHATRISMKYFYMLWPYFVVYSGVANTFMYGGFIGCFICLRRQARARISFGAPEAI
jgi:hypothetical protein